MGIIAEQWTIDQRVQLTVHRARGLTRLTGLICRAAPPAGCALLLTRCRAVHTHGMRHPIDVVFADSQGRVRDVRELSPRRFASCRSATQTFELRGGEATRMGIRRGAVLTRAVLTGCERASEDIR